MSLIEQKSILQVMEVYELFRDLATLVDIQQESLDVIENRIVHAQEYASKGEEELRKAETHQRKVSLFF